MLSRKRATLLLLGSSLLGCGGSKTVPADPTVAASQRLAGGNWRLLSFQPSLAIEEPLKGLLDAQMKQLTISFTGGEFSANGPGVNTGGRYEITGAEGDSFNGRIYDRAGAGYGVSAQFVGSELRFTSNDSPWAGVGVLARAQ
jgi:hypothetical protein